MQCPFFRLAGVIWFVQFANTVLFWMELLVNKKQRRIYSITVLRPVLWLLTLMYAICVAGFEAFQRSTCDGKDMDHIFAVLRTVTKGIVLALYSGLFLISARWTCKFYARLVSVYKNKRAQRRIRRLKRYLITISTFTIVWFVSSTLDSWDPHNPVIRIDLSDEAVYAFTFLEYLTESCVIFFFFAMQLPAELVFSLLSCGICRKCKKVKWNRVPSSRFLFRTTSERQARASKDGSAGTAVAAAEDARVPSPVPKPDAEASHISSKRMGKMRSSFHFSEIAQNFRQAGFDVQASVFTFSLASQSTRRLSFGEIEGGLRSRGGSAESRHGIDMGAARDRGQSNASGASALSAQQQQGDGSEQQPARKRAQSL